MPSDFQFKKTPLALGILKSCPRYGMDIFWNCPIRKNSSSSSSHSKMNYTNFD